MSNKLTNITTEKALKKRSAFLISEIIKDATLSHIWEENQLMLEGDPELDFTLSQRELYITAKTLLLDCIRAWGSMGVTERDIAMAEKDSIYAKIDKYMKLVANLEESGSKRYLARVDMGERKGSDPFKDAESVDVTFKDGGKINMKRGKEDNDEV